MLLDPDSGDLSVLYKVTKVRSAGEQGLLGLAIDPKWPRKPFVYAYATRKVESLQNQILKIKVDENKGISHKIIWRLEHKSRHLPQRRPHRLRPGPEAVRGRGRQPPHEVRPGPDERRGQSPSHESQRQRPAGQPVRRQPDLLVRHAKLVRLRVRPAVGHVVADREWALVRGRDQRHHAGRQLRVGREPDLRGQPAGRREPRRSRAEDHAVALVYADDRTDRPGILNASMLVRPP